MSTLSSQGQKLLSCLECDLDISDKGLSIIIDTIREIDGTDILVSPDQKVSQFMNKILDFITIDQSVNDYLKEIIISTYYPVPRSQSILHNQEVIPESDLQDISDEKELPHKKGEE